MKEDFKVTPLPSIEIKIGSTTLNTKQLIKMCKDWVHTNKAKGEDWVNYMNKRYKIPKDPLETIVNLLYNN